MIKVLIVEDSAVDRELLQFILGKDPDIRIAGTATNGAAALRHINVDKPDVITMDIEMPVMDGFEATRRIMETNPVPIVIVSSHWKPEETEKTLQAVQAGAVATLTKPAGIGHRDHDRQAQLLVRTVKAMAELKMVKRWGTEKYQLTPTGGATSAATSVAPIETESQNILRANPAPGGKRMLLRPVEIVAIGASTGGPPVLQTILRRLPSNFSAPILIVQHMTPGFLEGLREWLHQSTGMQVHIATHGMQPQPGHVYLAPDDFHMGVNASKQIALSQTPAENGLRPAVSVLFRSVAKHYPGSAAGILLTGMGRDGAAELKVLRDSGSLTFAQDEDSSLVYGMPGEANRLGAAQYSLPPEKIIDKLCELCQ